MSILRISNEYQCYPTWIEDDGLDNVDPTTLNISADLAARVDAWDESYQATYRADDPASSGFSDSAKEAAFVKEGHSLFIELKEALGNQYRIEYRPLRGNHLA